MMLLPFFRMTFARGYTVEKLALEVNSEAFE